MLVTQQADRQTIRKNVTHVFEYSLLISGVYVRQGLISICVLFVKFAAFMFSRRSRRGLVLESSVFNGNQLQNESP